MKSIVISELVWEAIAHRGKFGETEDDVLRRVFNLPPLTDGESKPGGSTTRSGRRATFATNKLSSYISGTELRLSFESGPSKSLRLPPKSDKAALRVIRDEAVGFAKKHGATIGQINAVRKTLTDAGYHLLK